MLETIYKRVDRRVFVSQYMRNTENSLRCFSPMVLAVKPHSAKKRIHTLFFGHFQFGRKLDIETQVWVIRLVVHLTP